MATEGVNTLGVSRRSSLATIDSPDIPNQHLPVHITRTVQVPSFPIPVRDEPVGGRLGHYWENWDQLGADPWVVQTLREGYRLEFSEWPSLATEPTIDSTPRNQEKFQAMSAQVDVFLQKQVIERVQRPETPGYYSRFFMVPKKEPGKWRSILDLSQLNHFIQKKKFKMETAESIREHLKVGMWATSIDLTDAYHHIPIHKSHRKYLRFCFQGQVYQYRALPMGLTSSPRVFTRIIVCIKVVLHKSSVAIHQYLDDWLTHALDSTTVDYHTRCLVMLTQKLGFMINLEKSELTPTQDCVFLSYRFRLDMGVLCPTEQRWEKILQKILPFLNQEHCSARQWQSLIGLLASTEKMVRMGMLHLRPIQMGLLDKWSPFRGDPEERIPITQEVKTALLWWTIRDNVMSGVPIQASQPRITYLRTPVSMVGGDIGRSTQYRASGQNRRRSCTSTF